MTKAEYQINKMYESLNLLKQVRDNMVSMPEMEDQVNKLYKIMQASYEKMYNENN